MERRERGGRPNLYMQIGQKGRKTGWEQARTVKRDVDGFENVEDYFEEEPSMHRRQQIPTSLRTVNSGYLQESPINNTPKQQYISYPEPQHSNKHLPRNRLYRNSPLVSNGIIEDRFDHDREDLDVDRPFDDRQFDDRQFDDRRRGSSQRPQSRIILEQQRPSSVLRRVEVSRSPYLNNNEIQYEEFPEYRRDEEVILIPQSHGRQSQQVSNEFDPFDGGSRLVRSCGSIRGGRSVSRIDDRTMIIEDDQIRRIPVDRSIIMEDRDTRMRRDDEESLRYDVARRLLSHSAINNRSSRSMKRPIDVLQEEPFDNDEEAYLEQLDRRRYRQVRHEEEEEQVGASFEAADLPLDVQRRDDESITTGELSNEPNIKTFQEEELEKEARVSARKPLHSNKLAQFRATKKQLQLEKARIEEEEEAINMQLLASQTADDDDNEENNTPRPKNRKSLSGKTEVRKSLAAVNTSKKKANDDLSTNVVNSGKKSLGNSRKSLGKAKESSGKSKESSEKPEASPEKTKESSRKSLGVKSRKSLGVSKKKISNAREAASSSDLRLSLEPNIEEQEEEELDLEPPVEEEDRPENNEDNRSVFSGLEEDDNESQNSITPVIRDEGLISDNISEAISEVPDVKIVQKTTRKSVVQKKKKPVSASKNKETPAKRKVAPKSTQDLPQAVEKRYVEKVHQESQSSRNTGNVRRSGRSKITPIHWWDNEIVKYSRIKTQGSIIGMPVIKEVVRVEEVIHQHSIKKRRVANNHLNQQSQHQPIQTKTYQEMNIIDNRMLSGSCFVKNSQSGEFENRELVISQPMIDWLETHENFDYAKTMETQEGKTTSTGFMVIRPGGEKPNRNTRKNTLTFVVITGKCEVTIHRTSIIVGVGTQFSVPAGNQYKLINENKDECRLFWVCMTGEKMT